MGRVQSVLMLLLAMFFVSVIACSSNSDTPQQTEIATTAGSATAEPSQSNTPADPSGDQPAPGIAVGERPPGFSPESLPLRKLTFSVQTPDNTPDDATVFLSLVDLTGHESKRVRMKNLGNGIYETQTEVLDNAMIRYNYDRSGPEGCCGAFGTREAIGDLFEMQYRLLLTDERLIAVNDTIAT